MIPSVKITDINKILDTLKFKDALEPFNKDILDFLDELSKDIKNKPIRVKLIRSSNSMRNVHLTCS